MLNVHGGLLELGGIAQLAKLSVVGVKLLCAGATPVIDVNFKTTKLPGPVAPGGAPWQVNSTYVPWLLATHDKEESMAPVVMLE
jgi:hypothetical protein